MSNLHYGQHYSLHVNCPTSMDRVLVALGQSATLRPAGLVDPVVIEPRMETEHGVMVRLNIPSNFPVTALAEHRWLRLLGEVAVAVGCGVEKVNLYNPWSRRTLMPGQGWSRGAGDQCLDSSELESYGAYSVLECGLWDAEVGTYDDPNADCD